MIDHKSNSDASGMYHDRSNGNEAQSVRASQCGNLADITANSTFIATQTTYAPLVVIAPTVAMPAGLHLRKT